jgi:hypothetical protein
MGYNSIHFRPTNQNDINREEFEATQAKFLNRKLTEAYILYCIQGYSCFLV